MRTKRRLQLAIVTAGAMLGGLLAPGVTQAAPAPAPPLPRVHRHSPDVPLRLSRPPLSKAAPSSNVLCATPLSSARNVMANCNEPDSPHNETAVAVNPLRPTNFVVGANDYQWLNATTRTLLSRAHVSFDAGRSWTDVALPYPAVCTFTGDPSLAFDAAGTLYYASICIDTESILLTTSHDGGLTWTPMVTVAAGEGDEPGQEVVGNDHPVLAAWGRGNVVVTWIEYHYADDSESQITTVPMAAAVSHDAGQHFGAVQVVSGSSPQCVGLTGTNVCDQTWGNAVAVSRDGAVLATFYNTRHYRPDGVTNLGRNTHFAVQLNPSTGALKAGGGPFLIGLAYDGLDEGDFPANVEGRQTLHDSQFRLLMQGNLTSDPINPRHAAVVWFDDRNASLPVSADPYQAQTNSDTIVSQTYDGGKTWSRPTAIRIPGDQFFPWAAYDALGRLQIGFMDRSYDPANRRYGYTLAGEILPGSLSFNSTQVTTALSEPTKDNRWSVTTVNPAFPNASRFIGDYSGIATVGITVVAAWTDQRLQSCSFGTCGHGEDTFVAVVRH